MKQNRGDLNCKDQGGARIAKTTPKRKKTVVVGFRPALLGQVCVFFCEKHTTTFGFRPAILWLG